MNKFQSPAPRASASLADMNAKGCFMIGALVAVGLVVIGLLYGVNGYNGFVGSKQKADSQWAQVDNVFQS